MKLTRLQIHSFRSIIDADIELHGYTMIVGANNAGKSNILAALRAFYDDIKWTAEDIPKCAVDAAENGRESWVQLSFVLADDEWTGLADKYKEETEDQSLTVRRYFQSKERVKSGQSNIYAIVGGEPEPELFYGAKNVGTAKVESVIYIPALTTPTEQMKTTGPSPLRNMLNLMLKRIVAGSDAYKALEGAFGDLNEEARGADGFLSQIADPINRSIEDWGIRFNLSINPITPQDITKNLVQPDFADTMLADTAFAIERYGHGFQRSFLYELIKLAPSFAEAKKSNKKEFDPDFTLILFEEPDPNGTYLRRNLLNI